MTIKTPTPKEREAVLICALAACQSMLKTCQRMLATSIAEASQLETDVAALRAELAEARGPGPAAIYSATPDDAEHSVTLADALPAAPPCRACSGERGRFENGPGHTDYWAGCDVCAGSGVCPLTE